MKVYMLKLTDKDHTQIKTAAAKRKITIKELIVMAVKELLKNE